MRGLARDEQTDDRLTAMVNSDSSIAHPSFPALEVFLAVARHGSFRRAAAERHVSPSALSHVIRGLEDTLGVRLFNRTNRSIRLTEAGVHLLNRIRPALSEITQAIAQVGAFRDRPAFIDMVRATAE